MVDRPTRLSVKSFFLVALVVVRFAHGASVSELEDRIGEQKKELSRMRSELEEGRKRLRELSEQAKNQEMDLHQVESNLQLGAKILEHLDSTEVLYKDLVQRSQSEVVSTTEAWRARRVLLAKRIRQMYEKGRPQPVLTWKSGAKPGDWGRILADFKAVARADRSLLDLVRARQGAAQKELEVHRKRVAGLEEVAQQKKQDLAALETERSSKAGSLAELRQGEERERKRLSELEASQKVLTQLLTELEKRRERLREERRKAEEEAKRREEERKAAEERRRKEVVQRRKEGKPPPPPVKAPPPPPVLPAEDKALAGPPPAKKGLCWPVQGAVLSQFGLEKNPVLGTVTRNLGVEIAGKAEQPVVAAAHGRVAAITQLPGRGTTVILEHSGGYFSIYGQLSKTKVSVGDAVGACAEVGTLAPDKPPRVYFEYRHNLKAEDPLEWLTK